MKKEDIPKPLLRITLSLVFLYFGYQQVTSPDNWIGFIPEFLTNSFLSPNNFVMFNGIMELSLGIFLIIGLYTRFSSFILSIHLLGIAASIGISPIGIRDFGLTIATFVVFLNGVDNYCLDKKFMKKEN